MGKICIALVSISIITVLSLAGYIVGLIFFSAALDQWKDLLGFCQPISTGDIMETTCFESDARKSRVCYRFTWVGYVVNDSLKTNLTSTFTGHDYSFVYNMRMIVQNSSLSENAISCYYSKNYHEMSITKLELDDSFQSGSQLFGAFGGILLFSCICLLVLCFIGFGNRLCQKNERYQRQPERTEIIEKPPPSYKTFTEREPNINAEAAPQWV